MNVKEITRELDDRVEKYQLIETDDGWYWQIEVKPYRVADIKRGITRPYKTREAAMKAVGKKIVEVIDDEETHG